MATDLIYVGKSRYKAKCAKCGKEIPIGTSFLWNKEAKQMFHEFCANPTERKEAGAQGAAKPFNSPNSPDAAAPAPLSEVAARLKQARGIVDKEFPDAKDYSDYFTIVGEVMRELYGEQWLSESRKGRL